MVRLFVNRPRIAFWSVSTGRGGGGGGGSTVVNATRYECLTGRKRWHVHEGMRRPKERASRIVWVGVGRRKEYLGSGGWRGMLGSVHERPPLALTPQVHPGLYSMRPGSGKRSQPRPGIAGMHASLSDYNITVVAK